MTTAVNSARGKRRGAVALGGPAARTTLASPSWLGRAIALLAKLPGVGALLNDLLINLVASSAKPRPLPYSLWGPKPCPPASALAGKSADYIAWPGLVDRSYSGRHLPVCSDAYAADLPPSKALLHLFQRGPTMIESTRSSALFCFFAQWFTDSFLRTDFRDYRRNTSNHEIDLCQIYGLVQADTELLREKVGGRLKHRATPNGDFPALLFNPDGQRVAEPFLNLGYIDNGAYRNPVIPPGLDTPERRARLFAAGLERGNSTIFYSALNTLFLREHNRLAREISQRHPEFDDDRVFEHARSTNLAQLLKIIIEDYINHLSSAPLRFFVDVGKAERRRWYRTNRISAEFDLLYRWHSMTPDKVTVQGQSLADSQFLYNNALLEQVGVETVLADAAQQPAGRIGLGNTPSFLQPFDLAAIEKSRAWRLRSYNDYREAFGLPRLHSTLQLARDPATAAQLEKLYGHVDKVELMVGLLAEAHGEGAVLGELMQLMVGVDAFTQALTNPLLSENIYGSAAFTEVGLRSLEQTSSLDDIARRTLQLGGRRLSFRRPGAPL
ncbi:MAG TPA: peroxidase family protein [Phenylobacterium sp.]|uniref:peroxidase family protein n=1 Tax=Phenylobacterium sp. TaxID=1871053 RepID=UPI002B471CA1|nr:peroxidase family protein [Phenylobacterium sp.]HKR88792.1 peroxidase family protein [Phenylobacterium sp.]